MEIIISDMEMPKSCLDCPCHDGECGRCNITKNYIDFDVNSRPQDCPLKESEPVIHAHWERHDEFSVCSHCWYSGDRSSGRTVETKYCPQCGAKMDEEVKQ